MKSVLFVASNATRIHFDFVKELERIQAARELAGGSFALTARWSLSANDLFRLIKEHRPDIVHVLSPGVNPANNGLMLDRGGDVEYVSPAALAKIFARERSKPPSLVFLNTCHSLKHAQAIAPHVGAVIAMKDFGHDAAAIEFATYFYISLALGSSVSKSFEEGRSAMFAVAPNDVDQPVLLTGTTDPSNITLAPSAGRLGCFGGPPMALAKPVKLFCSYSHKDVKFRVELETHLALLRQQDAIHVWHDRLIEPGSDWKRDIDENLEEADIVLLLVSADFVNSQYCMGVEMKRALERQKMGSARVVPILVRKCDLEGEPFTSFQWLPTERKPIKQWRDRDEAWTDVATGIRRVIETLH